MTTATKAKKTKPATKPAAKAAASGIDREMLKAVLGTLGRVVQSKPAKPILANVRLRRGMAIATDLEVRLELRCPCDGIGDLLLPHGRLSAIVGESASETVGLTPDGSSVVVTAGRGTWTLPTEPAAEFPDWEVSGLPVARLPADQLRQMLSAVCYATDSESSRYALGGVLLELKDGVLSAVATDGRRLSLAKADIDQATDDASLIIPGRAVGVLLSLLAGTEEGAGVQLIRSPSELVALLEDGSRMVARLLEGRFPRWRDVVPPDDDTTPRAAADNRELWSAVRQSAIVTTEQSKGVMFRFVDNQLELRGQSAENGESFVECALRQTGPSTKVRLDPKFVVDALQAFDHDEPVEIVATTPADRVVFYSGNVTAVVMPLAEE